MAIRVIQTIFDALSNGNWVVVTVAFLDNRSFIYIYCSANYLQRIKMIAYQKLHQLFATERPRRASTKSTIVSMTPSGLQTKACDIKQAEKKKKKKKKKNKKHQQSSDIPLIFLLIIYSYWLIIQITLKKKQKKNKNKKTTKQYDELVYWFVSILTR